MSILLEKMYKAKENHFKIASNHLPNTVFKIQTSCAKAVPDGATPVLPRGSLILSRGYLRLFKLFYF